MKEITSANKNTKWRSMDVLLKECKQCEATACHQYFCISNTLLGQKAVLQVMVVYSLSLWVMLNYIYFLLFDIKAAEHHLISTFIPIINMLIFFTTKFAGILKHNSNENVHRSHNFSQNVHISYYKTYVRNTI